jgi:hypothetical protein
MHAADLEFQGLTRTLPDETWSSCFTPRKTQPIQNLQSTRSNRMVPWSDGRGSGVGHRRPPISDCTNRLFGHRRNSLRRLFIAHVYLFATLLQR